MKYSIISALHNGIEFTSAFVNSIFKHTKDFEFILVDNGSTDGTKGYLQELKARNGNVKVISNPTNTTFAIANNQGLELAEGEYVVFINNDTVVFKDWADRLAEHMKNVPLKNIGIIGPVSQNSNGRQGVGVQDPDAWYARNRTRWAHAGVIYGWCMFMKRSLLTEIGGFDERFENAYEDNDLCLRAQLAGYKHLIAFDTYVHHKGQGTMRTLMDAEQYIENGRRMREVYRDKWNDTKSKKLVAVYRTNGGRHLEESLRQTSKFADSILIHFCRAPREFAAIPREIYIARLLKKFPKIAWMEFYDGIFQEDYERGRLLEMALHLHAEGKADWCISIDDDEIYEDKFTEKCRRMMSPRNPEVFGYWCQWRTIWERRGKDEYFRSDGIFGGFSNYRFFRLMKGQEIISKHPEGHHCGSAPWLAPENVVWSNVRVKHLGYDTFEQRFKKYQFYEANDHFKTAGDIGAKDYRHLIDVNVGLEKWVPDNGISLIMMVKNEEQMIENLLENVQMLVDEVVIVDTGSSDATVEKIEHFAAFAPVPVKLLHYAWEDNYSTPRNLAKLHATQKWILMLDADEKFLVEDIGKIFKMTESAADIIIFHVLNYMKATGTHEKPVYASTESVRLYRNIPELYYTGVLHEMIDDAICALQLRRELNIARSPAPLHHYGFLREKERVKAKLEYYVKLNNRQIEITEGKDPRPYFNLALHWIADNKPEEALKCFQRALELNPRFWLANEQMAVLNLNSAKEFLRRTIESIPETHPFKPEAEGLLKFLEERNFRNASVGV